MNLSFQDILNRLSPSYPTPLYGIFLYVIIAVALLTMFMQKKADLIITLFLFGTILCALIDKVAVGPGGIISKTSFSAFILRMPMFVFPLMVGGMTKTGSSRGPAILGGILGGVYLFMRWFLEMR